MTEMTREEVIKRYMAIAKSPAMAESSKQYAWMKVNELRRMDGISKEERLLPPTRQDIEHYIKEFEVIANDTSLSMTMRRSAMRDIKALKQSLEPKRPAKLVKCHCGEYYNPRRTLVHGNKHLIIGRKLIVKER